MGTRRASRWALNKETSLVKLRESAPERFLSRAFEVKQIGFVPVSLQIAAWHVNRNRVRRIEEARNDPGDSHRAGSGTTGKSFSRASFPDSNVGG